MRHTFTLANGVEIPAVGFGTYKAADGQDELLSARLSVRDTGTLTRLPPI